MADQGGGAALERLTESPSSIRFARGNGEPSVVRIEPERRIATGAAWSRGSLRGEIPPLTETIRLPCWARSPRATWRQAPVPRGRPVPPAPRCGASQPNREKRKVQWSKPKARTTLLARLPLWMKRAVRRWALIVWSARN